ncbi:hypothetical protein AA106556_1297 [Neokomagataea tanensis NBRC 106556]|uniref:Transposase n=1 Tax=Neokomagataea tanensis NBRC 106556 TaxID=1223519 RepID=A0ABQ0QJL0_9PROT|nr:hypothetical protein AA106556_1297 [Neokomagataea tanensis NBRC 106556]
MNGFSRNRAMRTIKARMEPTTRHSAKGILMVTYPEKECLVRANAFLGPSPRVVGENEGDIP